MAAAPGTTPAPVRLHFDLTPERTLHLMLFVAVANVPELRARILAKSLDVALVDAQRVASPFCVHVAAQKALAAAARGKGVAASLHAELLHCLHAGRNVGEALRVLGAREAGDGLGGSAAAATGTRDLLVCVFDAAKGILGVDSGAGADVAGGALAALAAAIQGSPTALCDYYGTGFQAAAGSADAGASAVGAVGCYCVPTAPGARPGACVDTAALAAAYKATEDELVLLRPPGGCEAEAGVDLAALEGAVVQRIATQDL